MNIEEIAARWPEKIATPEMIFKMIHPGDRIFVGMGCGEPQYLISQLISYVQRHPTAFFDAELISIVSLGVAPYTDERFRLNFRHNSFFISRSTREAVNELAADYTPVFLSAVPALFQQEIIPVDVALIQTTPPDDHGDMSLGISVDIVRAAVEKAYVVIAQTNNMMPRTFGDSIINIRDVDYVVPHDELLLEYKEVVPGKLASRIGRYVARIVDDGSTIQAGYGSIPNAVVANLSEKRHLGVHTELLSDGIVELIKTGAVDNSKKSLDAGKTVAAFCMGSKDTYRYINENPSIEFRTIDYTNSPMTIARQKGMTAINSALEIDLTGQATAESIGQRFYSGVGGQADFMRGAALAEGGKTIIALPSTTSDASTSRIVPFLKEGASVTITRGDVMYVVTEFGIAYLRGKSIHERALALISIASPAFQPRLIEEAKRQKLIFPDQEFIAGSSGIYPEALETYRTTRKGLFILLRPVKISDQPLLKEFLYSLSEESRYNRFISARRDIPRKMLLELTVIDYTKKSVILALIQKEGSEEIVGLGQYEINPDSHTAEVALAVRDDNQNMGVGRELLSYLTHLAKKAGLLGFTAEVLEDNDPVFRLFNKMGYQVTRNKDYGVYMMRAVFN